MPTALIAGGLGVTGRALVEHLDGDPDWQVIALSRRAPDFATGANFISVDLLDAADRSRTSSTARCSRKPT
jgi:nucleoside-diphosphate-sugar epimerase